MVYILYFELNAIKYKAINITKKINNKFINFDKIVLFLLEGWWWGGSKQNVDLVK